MRAELKSLNSPDVADLRAFAPEDPGNFGIFVQAMIGPNEDDASEAFDLTICTPRWLEERIEAHGPVLGLHHLVVASFDYQTVFDTVQSFCLACEGSDWREVGAKVARLGRWEFDGYVD